MQRRKEISRKMVLHFHPVSSKISFLCLFGFLAVQFQTSAADEETLRHRHKRAPLNIIDCNSSFKICKSLECDTTNCSKIEHQISDSKDGPSFCDCAKEPAFEAKYTDVTVTDDNTGTQPSVPYGHNEDTCKYTCNQVGQIKNVPYSGRYYNDRFPYESREVSAFICVCFATPKPDETQMTQTTTTTTADIVEVVKGLLEAVITFVEAVVQAVVTLVQDLASLDIDKLLTGVVNTVSGVLGIGRD